MVALPDATVSYAGSSSSTGLATKDRRTIGRTGSSSRTKLAGKDRRSSDGHGVVGRSHWVVTRLEAAVDPTDMGWKARRCG